MYFAREKILIGEAAFEKLSRSHVAVFGLGGVGSYAAEAIARAGIGKISIVDNDVVDTTNINRQLIALTSTIGKRKTDLVKERINGINPDAQVIQYDIFFNEESDFDFSDVDYVIDAIDTVTSKILLAEICFKKGIRIVSSMGTGNKLHPELFEIDDINNTSVCPLARVMRRELKKRQVTSLNVLYSKEIPSRAFIDSVPGRHSPGSISFVPSAAGLIIAGKVIRDLIDD